MHRMRASDTIGAGFGQTKITHLAGANQLRHRAYGFFDRRLRIDPMLIIAIDAINSDIPIQPSPIAETIGPPRPSFLCFMVVRSRFLGRSHPIAPEWRYIRYRVTGVIRAGARFAGSVPVASSTQPPYSFLSRSRQTAKGC